jgi:hypothetical protein
VLSMLCPRSSTSALPALIHVFCVLPTLPPRSCTASALIRVSSCAAHVWCTCFVHAHAVHALFCSWEPILSSLLSEGCSSCDGPCDGRLCPSGKGRYSAEELGPGGV